MKMTLEEWFAYKPAIFVHCDMPDKGIEASDEDCGIDCKFLDDLEVDLEF